MPTYLHAPLKAIIMKRAKADGSGLEAYDFTETAKANIVELREHSPEDTLFNTLPNVAADPKGQFTYQLDVIDTMTTVTSSAQLSAAAEEPREDKFSITYDKDWTKKVQFEMAVDAAVDELKNGPAKKLASLVASNLTAQRKGFWTAFYAGIVKAVALVGRDGNDFTKTANAFVATSAVDKLADTLVLEVDKLTKFGLTTDVQYPYAEGVPASQQIIVTNIAGLNEISKDIRFVATSSGEEMIRTGQVGQLLNVPVIISSLMDATVNSKTVKAVIMTTGQRSPVGLFTRVEFMSDFVKGDFIGFSELQARTNWTVKVIPELLPLSRVITAA